MNKKKSKKLKLDYGMFKSKEDTVLTNYTNKWFELANIDSWLEWTESMLAEPVGKIKESVFNDLCTLNYVMRDWNSSNFSEYEDLKAAFNIFREILDDFLKVAHRVKGTVNSEGFYVVDKGDILPYFKWADADYAIHRCCWNSERDAIDCSIVFLAKSANHIVELIKKIDSTNSAAKIGTLGMDKQFPGFCIPVDMTFSDKEIRKFSKNPSRAIRRYSLDSFA